MTSKVVPSVPHNSACHCGAVRIIIAHKPEYINDCNCTLCSSHGVLWGYYDPAEVSVSGDTHSYTRVDRPEPAVNLHFCGMCGCTTHWTMTDSFAAKQPDMPPRMGINMRLFGVETVEGVEVRFPNGRAL